MCFNARVSFGTYAVGTAGCLLLHRRGLHAEALFYGCVIQMQLIEFLLWHSQHSDQCARNRDISRIGLVVNHAEPFALYVGIMLFRGRERLPDVVHALMLLYGVVTVAYTAHVWRSITCTRPTPESHPHLHWEWNNQSHKITYYMAFVGVLVVLSLTGLDPAHARANAFLVLATFGLSWWIYRDRKVVGAMWCLAAAFVPFALMLAIDHRARTTRC